MANDGREGRVGESFLALWPTDRIAEWNAVLDVESFAPNLMVFATDGSEEAYAVDRANVPPRIVNVPLVGLGDVAPTEIGTDLASMLASLGGSTFTPALAPTPTTGKVIWPVQPIIFGGSPTDRANKRFVDLVDALKMAAWWNHRLKEARAGHVTVPVAD